MLLELGVIALFESRKCQSVFLRGRKVTECKRPRKKGSTHAKELVEDESDVREHGRPEVANKVRTRQP